MPAPEIIRTPKEVSARADAWRRAGRRIAFVPTMGYLHRGHVTLLEEGRARGDVLVLSIFVNPTQFGPREDLARYPRDLEGDLAKAAGAGTDVVYLPEAGDMYPPGYQTYVEVKDLARGLCGERRPGHFRGVATIVAKLFCAVKPHVAIFGEKDYQQLQVVRRLARDLDLDVEIVGIPTVREPDGLAMSSRNAYLSSDDRARATCLHRALVKAREAAAGGERDVAALCALAVGIISAGQPTRIDYVEARDAETLQPVARLERPVVMALAVFFGATRLIDNVVIQAGG
ncbi:MAG: pantoate--beta-alanine ligase [Deltaproteobacteria bacterium]|nr:pantoate--beta-alanine ligase [Deltaproteobacteria bacterium]